MAFSVHLFMVTQRHTQHNLTQHNTTHNQTSHITETSHTNTALYGNNTKICELVQHYSHYIMCRSADRLHCVHQTHLARQEGGQKRTQTSPSVSYRFVEKTQRCSQRRASHKQLVRRVFQSWICVQCGDYTQPSKHHHCLPAQGHLGGENSAGGESGCWRADGSA